MWANGFDGYLEMLRGRMGIPQRQLILAFALQLAGNRTPSADSTPAEFTAQIVRSAAALAKAAATEIAVIEKEEDAATEVARRQEEEQRKQRSLEAERARELANLKTQVDDLKAKLEKAQKPKPSERIELLDKEIADLKQKLAAVQQSKPTTPEAPTVAPKTKPKSTKK